MKTNLLTINGEMSDTLKDALREYRQMGVMAVRALLADTHSAYKDLLTHFDGTPPSVEEMVETLEARLSQLNERLQTPEAIYEDELNFLKDYLKD